MPKIEKYIRWIGIPLLAFLVQYLSRHDGSEQYSFWENYLHSLLFTIIYWNGAFQIFMLYRRLYPDISYTMRRLILTILTLTVFILFVSAPLRLLLEFISWEDLKDPIKLFEFFPVTLFVSIMVGSMYEGAFFFDKWKETIRINEALKNQQMRTQLEVLQNQMSPHFLFNSLNTLTTLIAEDQDRAIDFTQKLSEVYRYILQHRDRELVTLEEELYFADAYIFLSQVRFPNNLKFSINIPEHYRQLYIAPLTLQILIENAIKHNVVSANKPLQVEIYLGKGHTIMVKNNLQPKQTLEKSTKTGLANIRKRYEFMDNRQIDIITTKEHYMVAIPLIEVQKSKPALAEI